MINIYIFFLAKEIVTDDCELIKTHVQKTSAESVVRYKMTNWPDLGS